MTQPKFYEIKMEKLIFQAKLAESAERYENMFCFVKGIMKEAEVLDKEIRNLITVAFTNLVRQRISEWRVIVGIEMKELSLGRTEKAYILRIYRENAEGYITSICMEVLGFVEDWIQKQNQIEVKVFLLKLKEKAFRNLAEFQSHELNIWIYGTDSRDKQLRAEEEAFRLTTQELSPIDPIRLGLALSLAVISYDINGDSKKALSIAEEAFNLALPELINIPEENYKDVTLIMSMLRDNITLWSNDLSD
ncbi:unnamed protein product [Blepharisma stoltei]|uniref:14-3-3 domain-containing protein n=1 Tax=Blepharisma stoltei TaxID=1481888 RepID=A0AAU9JN37_9CILI|nr:unnamed protein product [Blepharisma stoltei]